MTNSNITVVIPNAGSKAASSNSDVSKSTDTTKTSFASMMSQNVSDNKLTYVKQDSSKSKQLQQPITSKSDPSCVLKNGTAKIKQVSNQNVKAQQKVSDIQEDLESDIKDAVKDNLSLTDEQLQDVMSLLGITALDLLNPANLAQVVTQVNGNTDISEMLTSNDFMNMVQTITDLTQNTAKNLGMSAQDMQTLIQQMNVQNENVDVSLESDKLNFSQMITDQTAEDINQVLDDKSVVMTQAEGAVQNLAHSQVNEQTSQDQVQNITTEQTTEETNNIPVQVTVDQDETQQQDMQSEDESNVNELFKKDDTSNAKPEHALQFAQTIDGQARAMNQMPIQQPVATYHTINVQDIMNQIADFAKINVSQETSSIEMQLNPENLGKVYLQISSTKDGNISAQFAASNDAVKDALETQVAQLRQTLNQQGIKVDAIEVTVASHEFEQNLEQNAQGEMQQGESRQEQRSMRRNLNMDNLDELSGLLTEEEVLAAKIMKENGNTLDVIA